MTGIIGQPKFVQLFSAYTASTMPAALLLLGEKGSGKTYLTQKFANKLGLELVKLSNQTTAEELTDYLHSPVLKLYHIDLSEVSDKSQNKFLKFIEEPSPSVKIILEAESEAGVLPTILNRCQKFMLEAYTVEELQSFAWAPKVKDTLIYKFYNTPGKLNTLANPNTFGDLQRFCEGILSYFPSVSATYADALTAATKICTKKEDTFKFDFEVFFDVFAYTAFEKFKETKRQFYFKAYLTTITFKQKLLNKAVAKEAAILSFLNLLWEVAHDTEGLKT